MTYESVEQELARLKAIDYELCEPETVIKIDARIRDLIQKLRIVRRVERFHNDMAAYER
jgi:hypothetical protein